VNAAALREEMAQYCVPKIAEMINRLDGLSDKGLVPRAFYSTPEGQAQQLTLFEESPDYDRD
jgi:hypothetical protein